MTWIAGVGAAFLAGVFPILVPGQVVTDDILAFMSALDTREIHGYLPEFGYRVFTESAMLARRDEGPA